MKPFVHERKNRPFTVEHYWKEDHSPLSAQRSQSHNIYISKNGRLGWVVFAKPNNVGCWVLAERTPLPRLRSALTRLRTKSVLDQSNLLNWVRRDQRVVIYILMLAT